MILNENQLRGFQVKKPWTRELAESEGAEALESWEYEDSTPALDDPPPLNPAASEALDSLFLAIPAEGAPFDYALWQTIAELDDAYIKKVGDLFAAAHGYTAQWGKRRNPTTLTPQGLELFDWIADDQLYRYARHIATHGVQPCGAGPRYVSNRWLTLMFKTTHATRPQSCGGGRPQWTSHGFH